MLVTAKYNQSTPKSAAHTQILDDQVESATLAALNLSLGR